MDTYNLNRFVQAQERDYATALKEIQQGRKQSHWMWYIFPQIEGLGFSSISQRYAIRNLDEARAYLQHPVLGARLIEISNALLQLQNNNANKIFGTPDDMKLRSSMTLFGEIENADKVFEQVLQKFFNGVKDDKTLKLLS